MNKCKKVIFSHCGLSHQLNVTLHRFVVYKLIMLWFRYRTNGRYFALTFYMKFKALHAATAGALILNITKI
jgi:hypothetical protein